MAERWPRLVGGDAALDFVNTDLFSRGDPRRRCAALGRGVPRLVRACRRRDRPRPSVPTDRSREQEQVFLRDAVEARSAIRIVAEAIAERRDADQAALATLRSAYSDAVDRAVSTLDDGRLIVGLGHHIPPRRAGRAGRCRRRPAPRRPSRSTQGVPELRVRVRRHHQERQPALVFDGGLRNAGEDAALRHQARGGANPGSRSRLASSVAPTIGLVLRIGSFVWGVRDIPRAGHVLE